MAINNSVKEQFRRNAVALISLVVAITGLSYNTWRNEASEDNRTQRLISLEVLLTFLVMLGVFDRTNNGSVHRVTWVGGIALFANLIFFGLVVPITALPNTGGTTACG